ncbi:MAG: L-threonine 3-dehydrogenase [Firmicutes bacterium]|nr:L-threonine 3-dehydrogenase [Bacillota bacterium]
MRAVLKNEPAPGAKLVDVPIPTPGSGEVLVRVDAASICGTDYHIYVWNEWAQNRIKPPQIMGHELAGEIVELGPNVTNAKVGDYISAESHIVCGHCIQCMIGEKHVCQNTSILGVDRDGCFAEYLIIPEDNLWHNDPDIPLDIASIQEPLGNATNTVLAGETRGRTMAVFGCGPIGLMAIGVAKACGSSWIAAIDINDYKLDLAKKMKADLTINSNKISPVEAIMDYTHGSGVDIVLEMSGAPAVFNQMLKVVRAGGRISLLGLPEKALPVNFSDDVVMRGLTMHGITGRRLWHDWIVGRELLKSGLLDLSPVVTHHFDLGDYAEGMDLMTKGDCGKIVLYPGGVR